MRKIIALLVISLASFGQNKSENTVFPKFENCQNLSHEDLKKCFYNQVSQHFYQAFETDSLRLVQDKVHLLFDIDEKGQATVFHINAKSSVIKEKVLETLKLLPKTEAGTF